MKLREIQEMEIATLSALFGDGEKAPDKAIQAVDDAGVCGEDFGNASNRYLFDALCAQLRRGQPSEFLELVNATAGKVARETIIEVASNQQKGVLAPRLAVIANAGAHRRLVAAMAVINGLTKLEGKPVAHIVAEAQKVLEGFSLPAQTLRTLDSETIALVDEVEGIASGQRAATLETGIPKLDEYVGGLQATLTILGAMPGVGKSGLMARIARNIAERGIKVGVFSLEDQSRWLVRRMVAESSSIPVFVLQNRPLNPSQRERFGDGAEQVHKVAANIVVEDRKGMTAKDIVASARAMLTRHQVKAIFVDHLGEVRIERSDRHDLDITDVLRELRSLADTYRVPVVVLCHVRRREGLDLQDEPRLTDFAFSSGVERMARVALALSKPSRDEMAIHVLKQTSGISGVTIKLRFNSPAAMATNLESETVQ